MEEYRRKNPWLGLESYKEGEVIYGRDDDIRDLGQSVLHDIVTLLYGKSGIGKSSILNAGIIPAARRHGFLPVLIRLSHKDSQPYLVQIKEAIENAILPIPVDENGSPVALTPEQLDIRRAQLALRIREVVECKDPSKESIYEYFHRFTFHDQNGERIKLLIIFDQFEEIFTLQTEELKKKHFFAGMADFLNDVMPASLQSDGEKSPVPEENQEEVNISENVDLEDIFKNIDLNISNHLPEYVTDNEIHCVFTIREDFLSEFEYYSASIPSLKQNRYGLRPLNEEQAAQIIMRPIPGLIDKSVAKLIIEKVTGRTDFELDGIPEIEVDSAVLSLYLNRLYDSMTGDKITAGLVEEKGGEIIADFYRDAISGISASTVEFLEDRLLNGQGRRDNITVFDALNEGNVSEKELDTLCNKKKILRLFNYAGDLRIEFVHDILCPVVKAHKDERILLRQQEEERRQQEEEKTRLLLEEKAKREKIEREAEEEKARLKAEAENTRRVNRRRLYLFGAFAMLLLVGFAVYMLLFHWEFRADYGSYTTVNGWPVGVGKKLSAGDIKTMPSHYQLVKYGYLNKYTRVDIVDSQGRLTQNNFDESPLVSILEDQGDDVRARNFANLQRNTSYWIFTPDNSGDLLRRTAYDADGNELYAIQYFRSFAKPVDDTTGGSQIKKLFADNTDKTTGSSQIKQLWANYVDRDGKSFRVRDNGADRVRILVNDSTMQFTGYQFFSETGTPQPDRTGAYGYRFQLAPDGRILRKIPVDEFGDSLVNSTVIYKDFDEYGNWIRSNRGNASIDNQLAIKSNSGHIDSLEFDKKGNLTYRSETFPDGSYRQYCYGGNGRAIDILHYRNTPHGRMLTFSSKIIPNKNHNIRDSLVYYADSVIPYRLRREESQPGRNIVTYFGGDNPQSLTLPIAVMTPEGLLHKIISDTVRENGLTKITKNHINTHGSPVINCEYNKSISYHNDKNEMVKEIIIKDDEILLSYIYEYDNGQVVSQSVMGLDGKPVRYAGWDINGLIYYKMRLIYNFANVIVAIKGINEFGEESFITTLYGTEYRLNVVPAVDMVDKKLGIHGIQVYRESIPDIVTPYKVDYIRISDLSGSWYKAGIRDGDLFIAQIGSTIKVARPNASIDSYDILSFTVPANDKTGVDVYPIIFTDQEMKRYTNSIK